MSYLTDSFCRKIDYLRISVTDRCNERCLYCMPEQYSAWTPREDILTYDEILAIVETSIGLGFKHFRITGGEPLIRQGIADFLREMQRTPGVETVQITTNGTRLPDLAEKLVDAGLKKINVSLDAIEPDVYREITKGDLAPVLEGIRLLKESGVPSIKLNTVLMRGKNEDQILKLIEFAAKNDLAIRFIELMPVSMSEMLDESNFMSAMEVKRMLMEHDALEDHPETLGHGPAKYYHLKNRQATVGFISALSDHQFCERCNKMRLTCDGKLRPCLGNHMEKDLMPALRPWINQSEIKRYFIETLLEKPAEHIFRENYQPSRIMTAIGG